MSQSVDEPTAEQPGAPGDANLLTWGPPPGAARPAADEPEEPAGPAATAGPSGETPDPDPAEDVDEPAAVTREVPVLGTLGPITAPIPVVRPRARHGRPGAGEETAEESSAPAPDPSGITQPDLRPRRHARAEPADDPLATGTYGPAPAPPREQAPAPAPAPAPEETPEDGLEPLGPARPQEPAGPAPEPAAEGPQPVGRRRKPEQPVAEEEAVREEAAPAGRRRKPQPEPAEEPAGSGRTATFAVPAPEAPGAPADEDTAEPEAPEAEPAEPTEPDEPAAAVAEPEPGPAPESDAPEEEPGEPGPAATLPEVAEPEPPAPEPEPFEPEPFEPEPERRAPEPPPIPEDLWRPARPANAYRDLGTPPPAERETWREPRTGDLPPARDTRRTGDLPPARDTSAIGAPPVREVPPPRPAYGTVPEPAARPDPEWERREERQWQPQAIQEPPPAPRQERAEPRKRSTLKPLLLGMGIGVVLLLILGTVQYLRPVPAPKARLTVTAEHTFSGTAPVLPWPANTGQAAVSVEGIGSVGSTGAETPTPTASVAKVMTAYVFLKDHPLKAGAAGPTFTIGAEEAARLTERKARDESLINVTAGEALTERQALQALLVVSANNIAHEIARWDAGGDAQFVAKMNATAKSLGMTNTTYTDPSGFDATTMSTAADQVKLLRAAMALPGFAEAAATPVFDIPGDDNPPKSSTNALLGVDGVVGGKTGYTGAAGGNFVFAARKDLGGVKVLIVGAVMNQKGVPSSEPTVQSTKPLIEAVENSLSYVSVAAKGATVGQVEDGLGGSTPLVAAGPVSLIGWPGRTVRLELRETEIPHHLAAGSKVGSIGVGEGATASQIPLRLGAALNPPALAHRLTRLA